MPTLTPQSTLAETILTSKMLLSRYLAGFTDENHTRQAPGLPNHVAWSLGHLALTMHRVGEKVDGRPIPTSDFTAAAPAPAGKPLSAFFTESVAFNSTPLANPALYPTLARCMAIFEAACDRVAAAARSATDSQLAQTTKWGQGEVTISALLGRMAFHNGTHTGQIADLRRALGFKSIFA